MYLEPTIFVGSDPSGPTTLRVAGGLLNSGFSDGVLNPPKSPREKNVGR
jgi:hypothetical protein